MTAASTRRCACGNQLSSASVNRIGVAVVGTGFFGGGLLRRLAALPEFEPRLVANRTLDHGLAALDRAGISRDRVVVTDDPEIAQTVIEAGRIVVTTDLQLAAAVGFIDVVAECTG